MVHAKYIENLHETYFKDIFFPNLNVQISSKSQNPLAAYQFVDYSRKKNNFHESKNDNKTPQSSRKLLKTEASLYLT